jgi:hypothetical protein
MNAKLKSYKDLIVWRKSLTLVTQTILAIELDFCSGGKAQPILDLIGDIQKMANALRRSLASRP